MADKPDYRTTRLGTHIEEIDTEIARLCLLCKVRILDPGVIERVLKNDAQVCGTSNPKGFAKLRSMLMMHYSAREKAVVTLGPAETLRLVDDIVARLRKRFGDSLGTRPV
jgi:hypothetical protein